MTESKCMYCKDSGWLWRHELPDTSDWDGSSDDTRYPCTYCECEIAESSRCKKDRLKKGAELAERNRIELLENDFAILLKAAIREKDSGIAIVKYLYEFGGPVPLELDRESAYAISNLSDRIEEIKLRHKDII